MLYNYPKNFIVPVIYINNFIKDDEEKYNGYSEIITLSEYKDRCEGEESNDELLDKLIWEESIDKDNFQYDNIDYEYADNEIEKN